MKLYKVCEIWEVPIAVRSVGTGAGDRDCPFFVDCEERTMVLLDYSRKPT